MEWLRTYTEEGNTMEVVIRDDYCNVTLDHPWAGSTDEGFGQTLGHNLTRDQAAELGAKLIEWAAAMTVNSGGNQA